jgi:hypothetical protein
MHNAEFSITDQGNLQITLTDRGHSFLKDLLSRHPDWDDVERFMELIDYQLNHGWYIVQASQIRAQTTSLILTNSVKYDHQGSVIDVGDVFWYPYCEIEPYTDAILKKGFIMFERSH